MTMHPLLEFGEHMIAGDGNIECGETWSLEHGWRAYMKAGTKAIMMPPRSMRKLGMMYRDQPGATKELRDLGVTMIECANAAKAKNDAHVIPDDAAEFVPHVGTA
jgi:hypothetical protein